MVKLVFSYTILLRVTVSKNLMRMLREDLLYTDFQDRRRWCKDFRTVPGHSNCLIIEVSIIVLIVLIITITIMFEIDFYFKFNDINFFIWFIIPLVHIYSVLGIGVQKEKGLR